MPDPPAELTAEITVAGPDAARAAARDAAGATGLALDAGPGETMLSGSAPRCSPRSTRSWAPRSDAGAHEVDVRLEAPSQSRQA